MTTVDDLLKGGGASSLSFIKPGTSYAGVIVSSEATQQTDFKPPNAPKFYDDGKPMMQIVVTLLTAERDPADTDDDGTRRFYAKGAGLAALRAAVGAVGAKSLEPGAGLHITYTHDGEAAGPGLNPPKQFSIVYTPAVNAALAPPAAPVAAATPDVAALQAELEALKAKAAA